MRSAKLSSWRLFRWCVAGALDVLDVDGPASVWCAAELDDEDDGVDVGVCGPGDGADGCGDWTAAYCEGPMITPPPPPPPDGVDDEAAIVVIDELDDEATADDAVDGGHGGHGGHGGGNDESLLVAILTCDDDVAFDTLFQAMRYVIKTRPTRGIFEFTVLWLGFSLRLAHVLLAFLSRLRTVSSPTRQS